MSRRGCVLLTVSLATFMTYLDNDIVNVALPAIQRDLSLSTSGLEWVVSAYVLVFASLLLAGGRLADVVGRRRMFSVGLVVFTLASLAAGWSGNAGALIVSRAGQGLGAALVTPTTLAILSTVFTTTRERAAAIAVWSAVGSMALAVGPLLGGVISQHLSWGWIFFINAPIGAVTVALAAWCLPADPVGRSRVRMDLPGVATSALALFTLTYALIEGPNEGWGSPAIAGCCILAVVSVAGFVVVERRYADPMVDVSLFRDRIFTGGIVAVMLWAFGLFGIYVFTSLYLQGVLRFSPTVAGTAFIPMAVLMALTSMVAERVAARAGAHRSVGAGMVLMGLGMVLVTLFGRHATFAELMPAFAMIGIGGGLAVPLTALVVGTMPEAHAGVASGIFNASREVAGLLGITVIGAVLTSRQDAALAAGRAAADAFLTGYRSGLLVAAVLVAAGGVVAFLSLRRAAPAPDTAERPELLLAG